MNQDDIDWMNEVVAENARLYHEEIECHYCHGTGQYTDTNTAGFSVLIECERCEGTGRLIEDD